MKQNIINKIKIALGLSANIVGIKFLTSSDEYRSFGSKPAKSRLAYCNMVKLAASGRRLKVEDQHFKCSGARRAFGFSRDNSAVDSGECHHQMGLYQDRKTAQKVVKDMAYLDYSVHGMGLFPFENNSEKPDVIIIISNTYTAMRIIQGYSYHFGITPNIRFVGNQGMCSELTVRPFLNKDINVSLLCSGTRFLCGWKDSDIGVAMTSEICPEVFDGVLETLNPTEPDKKKREIIHEMNAGGLNLDIRPGESYYMKKPGNKISRD